MKRIRIGGIAALAAALAIGLALSLGLWGSWTASAQDTFIVNDDTSPADGGCDTPNFLTEDIENAIDHSDVSDGDTLVICEGTYNPPDPIQVTKVLTIEGRAAANRDDIVVQGSGAGDGFIVSVDGATIRHLKLDAPSPPTADDGIVVNPGSDAMTLSDVEVAEWHNGIAVEQSFDTVIEKSYVHDNGANGVALGKGKRNVVRDNEIKDNGVDGVTLHQEDEALVEGNTLSGNDASQIDVSIDVHVRIYRNQIDTTSDGIRIGAAAAYSFVQIGGSPDNANTFTGPFGGTSYYVRLDCDAENTVDATYNWWGSINRTDIASRIYNDEDDPATECPAPDNLKGAVVFHPWATGPAPTPTATATGTPTPTATPGATRTIDLSPQGWHDLAWSGADATDPGTALACISGKYNIAYAWEGPAAGFKRYVEGCAIPGICTMGPLDKYDTLLVNISATGVTCQMPVVP